jgi:hypothetical protein
LLTSSSYLIVDYERANFSVHQRVWPTGAPAPANVVPITPLAAAEPTTKKKKEAGPDIAAIVSGSIGGLALLAVIAGTILLALKRQKRINSEKADAKASPGGSVSPDQSDNSNPSDFSIHSNEMVMPYQTTHRSLTPNTNSIYGNEVRPSSMWDLNSGPETGPRPTSSIYEQDQIDHTRQTVVGGLGPPEHYRHSGVRFSAADWTSQYEPTIMEKQSSDLSTQRYYRGSAMPSPIEIRKSMAIDDRGPDPFEDVDLEKPKKSTEIFKESKKPFWI